MRSLGLGAVVALLLGASPATAAPSFVIRGDTKIGTFAVQTDGSLAGAIRAFGAPRLRRSGEACTATWAAYGLTMSFYNLGGQNPCTPRYGRFSGRSRMDHGGGPTTDYESVCRAGWSASTTLARRSIGD
jgi:hypothetical protein